MNAIVRINGNLVDSLESGDCVPRDLDSFLDRLEEEIVRRVREARPDWTVSVNRSDLHVTGATPGSAVYGGPDDDIDDFATEALHEIESLAVEALAGEDDLWIRKVVTM